MVNNIKLLLIAIALLCAVNVYAQDAKIIIGKASAGTGDTVVVPVNVVNFNNVGAISLKISYDTSALIFAGIKNSPSEKHFIKNAVNGIVMLGWFDETASSPINIENGRLLELLFIGNGAAGDFKFVSESCEISDASGKVLPIKFINGE